MPAQVWVGIRAAMLATGRVLGMLGAGAYFAKYKMGSPDVWRGVNLLASDLLIPCLSVVACAKAVSWESLHDLAIFPLLLIINTALPALVGYLLPYLSFGLLKPSTSTLCVLSLAFPNVVSLPVPVFLALYDELEWVRRGLTPEDDTKQQGTAYCYLYGSMSLLILWSMGYDMLVREKANETRSLTPTNSSCAATNTPPLSPALSTPCQSALEEMPAQDRGGRVAVDPPASPSKQKHSATFYLVNPRALCVAIAHSPVCNPVTVSIVLGVVIGLVPPLRHAFVGSSLYECMDYMGQTAPPLCVVCMGAGMVMTNADQKKRERDLLAKKDLLPLNTVGSAAPASPESAGPSYAGIVLIAFGKLVVINALLAAATYVVGNMGLFKDKTMLLVFLLFAMSPAANNVTVVAARAEILETESSQVAFCQQLMCLVTIPVTLVFHIWMLHEEPK